MVRFPSVVVLLLVMFGYACSGDDGGVDGAVEGDAFPTDMERQGDTPSDGEMDASVSDEGVADQGVPDEGVSDEGVDTAPDAGDVDCDAPALCEGMPTYDPIDDWRHGIATRFTVAQGSARHRGRDLLLAADDPQWALAKFAYGIADDDLKDEDVDVYVQRDDCSLEWSYLGRATTSNGSDVMPTVERIEDDGGRVYFQIPADQRLGPGRHRIHFVVRGDHSTADQFIQVLHPGQRVAVSDVDGTLTESENAEFAAIFGGASPAVNSSAPEALWALSRRGYLIFYVTARPDWLSARTHEWTAERGLPPGLVHTTLGGFGATGAAAVRFKTAELGDIAARLGRPVDIAIGNRDSDAEAYRETGIEPAHRFLYQLPTDDPMGAVEFDDYADLVAVFEALPQLCF